MSQSLRVKIKEIQENRFCSLSVIVKPDNQKKKRH